MIVFLFPFSPVECKPDVDLCLIIDVSSNIQDQNPTDGTVDYIEQTLEYLASLTTETLNIGLENTRLGIVGFGERAQLQFSLGTDKDPDWLRDSLRELGSSNMGRGPPNPAQALNVARQQCFDKGRDREDVRNVTLLVTTGMGLSQLSQELNLAGSGGSTRLWCIPGDLWNHWVHRWSVPTQPVLPSTGGRQDLLSQFPVSAPGEGQGQHHCDVMRSPIWVRLWIDVSHLVIDLLFGSVLFPLLFLRICIGYKVMLQRVDQLFIICILTL